MIERPQSVSPSSPSSQSTGRFSLFGGTKEEREEKQARLMAHRAVQTAQMTQRISLIGRRDVLAYFDSARSLGTMVFNDPVPVTINAVFCVSAGTLTYFMDGGGTLTDTGGQCGPLIHFFVISLIGISYILLGLLSFVAMGYRVVLDISVPFVALIGILAAYCVSWVFFGLSIAITWMKDFFSGGPDASSTTIKCFTNQMLLSCASASRCVSPLSCNFSTTHSPTPFLPSPLFQILLCLR